MIPFKPQAAWAAKFSVLLATVLVSTAASSLAQTVPADQIAPTALKQMRKMLKVKGKFSPAEQKISSNIALASRQARFLPIGGTDIVRTNIDNDGLAKVKITGKVSDKVLSLITDNGGQVLATYKDQRTIIAKVPLTALPTIAASPKVKQINEPDIMVCNVGAVTTQGYVALQAKEVVEGLGIDGTGIKVGVLSDSASPNTVAALEASGDLPSNTTVLPGEDGALFGEDEGAAMMEIIHDMAPGAQLFFATAEPAAAAFAANITLLSAQGCTVIVDDVSYLNEGVFQDDTVAQAVNTFVSGGGIYFSAAANSGNLDSGTAGTWEGDFLSGGPVTAPVSATDPAPALIHNFGTAASPVLFDTLTAASTDITLKWSDPLNDSSNDYDLFVLDSTGSTVLGSSTSAQTGIGSSPYESATPTTSTADPATGVVDFPVGSRIVIVQSNTSTKTQAIRALHLDTNRGSLSIATAGNTYGHNAAANTQTVAATFWNSAGLGTVPFTGEANPVELFSSDGPRKIFYSPTGTLIGTGNPVFANTAAGEVLLKPDFTAADGVTCKTTHTDITTGVVTMPFSPFFGTSAAAPHAAAIAALMMSAHKGITNTQIHDILVSTAMDNMTAFNQSSTSTYDRDGGYGVLDAYTAVMAALALP